MAQVDDIRVFRGIYSGFALAMSEVEEGVQFHGMPSSDELASQARELCGQVIADDERENMPAALQEFVSMAVSLALVGHGGKADRLDAEPVAETLGRLVDLVDPQRARRPVQVPAQAS